MQSESEVLVPGQRVYLTSLVTDKYVQYNENTKQLDANGRTKSRWEVLRVDRTYGSSASIQLRHLSSKLFLHMAEDFLVDLSRSEDVSCDLKVVYHPMPCCVSLEFVAYPNCFVGFQESGEPKTATNGSCKDMFSVTVEKGSDIHDSGHWNKPSTTLTRPPIFYPLPPKRLYEAEKFDAICFRRAEEFNQQFREIEVMYLGRLAITIEDWNYLDISKEGRKVYMFLRGKLGCFGSENFDEIRVNANGKYPRIEFTEEEHYLPVFQAVGRIIGRQVTEIELQVFRERPKWLDKKESYGVIRLGSLIFEEMFEMDTNEQIRLKCEKTRASKGSLVVHLHFNQYKPL